MLLLRRCPVIGSSRSRTTRNQSIAGCKQHVNGCYRLLRMSHQLKGGPANIRTGSRQQCPRAAKCGNFTGVNADVKLGRRLFHFTNERKKDIEKHSVRKHQRQLLESTKNLRLKLRSSISRLQVRENLYTIPNILTYSRLIAAPAVGYLVIHEKYGWAVVLFLYAGITDVVDGWIARRWKLQTVVGSVVDPMADKILMTVLVGCLAAKGLLPLWIATLILGRDISLGLAAIYYRWASLPPPKTFSRYWDFSLPSASVHPTTISKLNTLLQLVLIGATTALPLLTTNDFSTAATTAGIGQLKEFVTSMGGVEGFVHALQYFVAATTVWSGASYVWVRNAVRILGSDEALKRRQGRRGRALIGMSFAAFVALSVWLDGA